jgi:hypothetical protein
MANARGDLGILTYSARRRATLAARRFGHRRLRTATVQRPSGTMSHYPRARVARQMPHSTPLGGASIVAHADRTCIPSLRQSRACQNRRALAEHWRSESKRATVGGHHHSRANIPSASCHRGNPRATIRPRQQCIVRQLGSRLVSCRLLRPPRRRARRRSTCSGSEARAAGNDARMGANSDVSGAEREAVPPCWQWSARSPTRRCPSSIAGTTNATGASPTSARS